MYIYPRFRFICQGFIPALSEKTYFAKYLECLNKLVKPVPFHVLNIFGGLRAAVITILNI